MLQSETVVEKSDREQSNQMGYWQPNIVPVQVYPVPVYPVIIHNNTFPGKIPLYCGSCQTYGCKCFYQHGSTNFGPNMLDDNSISMQNRYSPALKAHDYSRKAFNSKSLREVERQHEYYKNAAVAAYFNYLKLAPTSKLNELNLLAENFNQKLNLDRPRNFNNSHITTTFFQSSQAPIHSSVELAHDNDINVYLHSNQNKKSDANKKNFDYSNTNSSTPTSRYPTYSGKKPKRSQVLCRFGNNCKFYKENKCKFYHPVKFESKKNSIDITDYSIDDGSELDFIKENQTIF